MAKGDSALERATSANTHYLFLRIIAVVGQSSTPMTVTDLARALKADPKVIAQCVALHSYLERNGVGEPALPPPPHYWVPGQSDVITTEMLRPRGARRLFAVDAVIRHALGVIRERLLH